MHTLQHDERTVRLPNPAYTSEKWQHIQMHPTHQKQNCPDVYRQHNTRAEVTHETQIHIHTHIQQRTMAPISSVGHGLPLTARPRDKSEGTTNTRPGPNTNELANEAVSKTGGGGGGRDKQGREKGGARGLFTGRKAREK